MTTRVPTQSWLPESKLASYGSMYVRMDGRKKRNGSTDRKACTGFTRFIRRVDARRPNELEVALLESVRHLLLPFLLARA